MKRAIAFAAALVLAAQTAAAQSLTIGPVFTRVPDSQDLATAIVRTDIDLEQPASASGDVTHAHVYWQIPPPGPVSCGSTSYKIKFFRRTGNSLKMIAERGPFTVPGEHLIGFASVAVLQGDLIGITRTADACASVGTFSGFPISGYLQYAGDVTGTVDVAAGTQDFRILAVSGSGVKSEALGAVVPVVGSTTGAFGSHFTTSLQLANYSATAVSGRIVFHAAGVAGTADDPSVPYSITGKDVVTFKDLLAEFRATGMGSIDIFGDPPPAAVAQIFDDTGRIGLVGMTVNGITADFRTMPDNPFLKGGTTSALITPSDPSRTRFNIGVRTFFSGVKLTATLTGAGGAVRARVSKSYPATWFEQVDASTFLGGVSIGANELVTITVSEGSAIVYATTTDNVSNDTSIQIARVIFAIG